MSVTDQQINTVTAAVDLEGIEENGRLDATQLASALMTYIPMRHIIGMVYTDRDTLKRIRYGEVTKKMKKSKETTKSVANWLAVVTRIPRHDGDAQIVFKIFLKGRLQHTGRARNAHELSADFDAIIEDLCTLHQKQRLKNINGPIRWTNLKIYKIFTKFEFNLTGEKMGNGSIQINLRRLYALAREKGFGHMVSVDALKNKKLSIHFVEIKHEKACKNDGGECKCPRRVICNFAVHSTGRVLVYSQKRWEDIPITHKWLCDLVLRNKENIVPVKYEDLDSASDVSDSE